MILVGQYDSPYTRRVAITMHLYGIAFARDTRSVFADAEAMRTINPLGRIPSLILDDGEVLIESWAMLDHLDELVGPERALLPARGKARRDMLQLCALACGTLDKAGAITYERSLRPKEMQYEPWLARCKVQVEGGIAALEARVGDGWCGGARPMQPDVTIGCVLDYLRTQAWPLPPRLSRLLAACDQLPAFAATVASSDEAMPSSPL